MRKTLQVAAAAAALVAGGSAQAVVINTIDLFTTNQARVEDNGAVDANVRTSQVGGISDATIFGGYRELIVQKKSNPDPDAAARMNVFNGALSFSTDASATGTGIVRWDGATAGADNAALTAINATGLQTSPGVGLFLGNALTDTFALDVLFSDAGFNFVLEAYTDSANWSKVSITSLQHLSPTTTYIPLAAFLDCTNASPVPGVTVTCGGSGVDFTNVGALQAVIDPAGSFTSLDLRLGQVQVVPEPGALALVGLALAGAGLASRRRKA